MAAGVKKRARGFCHVKPRSELIAGRNADVARFAVDDGTIDVGVVGFVEQVIDVTLHSKIFSDLVASEHIHQRVAAFVTDKFGS